MDRKDVLKSPEYWTAKTQVELYNQAYNFMTKSGKNQTQLAEYLGVSKGYISQLLNGDYNHRLSKFFELSLAFGVIPHIEFIPVENYIKTDAVFNYYENIILQNVENTEWREGEICMTYSTASSVGMYPENDPLKKVA